MRRALAMTTIFLACGVAVTIGVAWACAAWSDTSWWAGEHDDDVYTWPSWAPMDWPVWLLSADGERSRPDASAQRGFGLVYTWHQVISYERLPLDPQGFAQRRRLAWRGETGWPARALVAEGGVDERQVMRWVTALPAPGGQYVNVIGPWGLAGIPAGNTARPLPVGHGIGALPFFPLWRGFALDTTLYGASLAAAYAAARAARRAVRRRRGLCPACGYPVGVSPTCTECGAALA